MENDSQKDAASAQVEVKVSDWIACYNEYDKTMVLSCTVTASHSKTGISGVGIILNTSEGSTVASIYTSMSSPSETVNPSLNVEPTQLKVGDSVLAVAQGECNGQHFFFEERLNITECQQL